MKATLGAQWPEFESAHAMPAPVSLRLNPQKASKPPATTERIPWTSHGYYLPERPVFTLDPLFHAGCYYVQEASSMFVEQFFKQYLEGLRSLKVLDLCAAPGGKSTHLLSLMAPDSLLVTNEVIRSRVSILSENIQKWGYPNAVVTNNDPADFSRIRGFFDVILVDAPCSGEGLFRKDPSAMEEWSEANVAICSQRQQRIIDDIWPCLKEDGILIYCTCTYSSEEDEDTLKRIAGTYNVEFLSVDKGNVGIEEISSGSSIGYRFYPHKVAGEGFFVSAMRKKETEQSVSLRTSKPGFAAPQKKHSEEINNWLNDASLRLIQRDDLIQGIPDQWAPAVEWLSQRLRLVYAGTFLTTVKQNRMVPEHSLALSTLINTGHFHCTELSYDDALAYLRKEVFNPSGDYKGFSLATYNGVPMGWMNLLGGRMNNLYPSEWRIRMKGNG